MNKTFVLLNSTYYLIENYKDGFHYEELKSKMTEYFEPYDYIVGDWSYGKLRLKGFCERENSIYRKENDIKGKEQYIQEYCAYECKYFVLKKCKDNMIE